MKKNPYSELLGIMDGVGKNNQAPIIQIGTILEPPPNIKVRYKSIILESSECYISEYLLTEPRTGLAAVARLNTPPTITTSTTTTQSHGSPRTLSRKVTRWQSCHVSRRTEPARPTSSWTR